MPSEVIAAKRTTPPLLPSRRIASDIAIHNGKLKLTERHLPYKNVLQLPPKLRLGTKSAHSKLEKKTN